MHGGFLVVGWGDRGSLKGNLSHKNRVVEHQMVLFFQAALDVGGRVGNLLPTSNVGNHGGQPVAHPTVGYLLCGNKPLLFYFVFQAAYWGG